MRLHYYYFPASHWSRVCSQVLVEKGLWADATRKVVDIRRNENYEPDYLRINPRGVVPTVVIDREVICNTPVIVRALDAVADPIVHPPDPRVDQWARRLEELKLMHLSYHVWTKGDRGEKSAWILDDKVDRAARYAEEHVDLRELYERKRVFFQQFRDEVYDPAHRDQTRSETIDLIDAMGQAVEESPWIAGEEWSWADALAASILWRLEDLQSGLAIWLETPDHPVAEYFARIKERESFRIVFHEDPALSKL